MSWSINDELNGILFPDKNLEDFLDKIDDFDEIELDYLRTWVIEKETE